MIASGQQEINLTNRPPTALFRKRGLLPCRKRGGGGTLDSLEVGMTVLTPSYQDGIKHYLAEDLSRPRVEFLLTYLAGSTRWRPPSRPRRRAGDDQGMGRLRGGGKN